MNLVSIEQHDHAVLRNSTQEIAFPLSTEIKEFIAEMRAFIGSLDSPNGHPAGLAAPQVGSNLKLAFIYIPPLAKERRKDVYDIVPLTVMINPSYKPLPEDGKTRDWEGCYSVSGKMGEVDRYHAIEYSYYNEQGELITGIARGFKARVMQHEIGHLNGQLYIDIVAKDARYGDFEEMKKLREEELKRWQKT